jgi:hypothetical protein
MHADADMPAEAVDAPPGVRPASTLAASVRGDASCSAVASGPWGSETSSMAAGQGNAAFADLLAGQGKRNLDPV